jgi:hypothetical protein
MVHLKATLLQYFSTYRGYVKQVVMTVKIYNTDHLKQRFRDEAEYVTPVF